MPLTILDRLFHVFRFLIPTFFIFIIACSCETGSQKTTEGPVDLLQARATFAIEPILKVYSLGDTIPFTFRQIDSTQFDSIFIKVDGSVIEKIFKPDHLTKNLKWVSTTATTGSHVFSVIGFSGQNDPQQASHSFFLKSNLAPEIYGYRIIKTLPHNPESFTQGLEWNGNQLFEGTGLNGKSAIMQVDPSTGKEMIRKDLPQEFFGEGITIVGDKLVQITWQNKRGFVYQLPALEKIKEFGYSTDGWGLTHWNKQLVMSDGTNRLFFLNPDQFNQTGLLEVWDNKKPIEEINELEEIDGFIFANKYRTDTLLKIDPKSGKILAYIDLTGILPESDRTGDEDVLNGIAWRADEKLIYVTGKNWPKMYAIKLVKKQAI